MFIITRFRYIVVLDFTITMDGAKDIVRYTEDFVKSRFHCTQSKLLLPLICKEMAIKTT